MFRTSREKLPFFTMAFLFCLFILYLFTYCSLRGWMATRMIEYRWERHDKFFLVLIILIKIIKPYFHCSSSNQLSNIFVIFSFFFSNMLFRFITHSMKAIFLISFTQVHHVYAHERKYFYLRWLPLFPESW